MQDMVITTTDTEFSAAAGGKPSGNHSAWLKQLESAQWQQRLRYKPSGEQQHGLQFSGKSDAAKPVANAVSVPLMDRRSADVKAAQMSSPDSAAGDKGRNELTARPGLSDASPRWTAAALAPQQGRPTTPAHEWPQLPAHLPRQLSRVPWQAKHVHAMLDAEGVKLWLRDAQYEAGDGPQLLQSLRGHFARLGLRLTQFTLNGTAILKPEHYE